MKKNVKNVAVKVVGVVSLVMGILAAYYGVSMFQLQNNVNILATLTAILWGSVAIYYLAVAKRKNAKKWEIESI